MSLVGFKARNHQQQLVARGPALDVDERIRFLLPGQTVAAANTRPPFGCALLIFESIA